jgi:hypothetical protein
MSALGAPRRFSHVPPTWDLNQLASPCRCAGPSCCKFSVTAYVWSRLEPTLFPFLSKPLDGPCNGLVPISLSMKLALGFFGYVGAYTFSHAV